MTKEELKAHVLHKMSESILFLGTVHDPDEMLAIAYNKALEDVIGSFSKEIDKNSIEDLKIK